MIEAELTAGLFCVVDATGRAYFTSSRAQAHNTVAVVGDRMREENLPGVHNIRAQWLDGNVWRDCLVPR